jgi:hypothetical protein
MTKAKSKSKSTKFVMYERVKRGVPTFSTLLDVGDRIYRFDSKLEASQGRSSLVGALTEIKQVKVCDRSELLHVLPPGSLLEGNDESDTVSAPESSWLTTPLEPPL